MLARSALKIAGARSMAGLAYDNISDLVKKAEYAVRGELVIKAAEYGKMLAEGKKLPFKQLVSCNIGNPHALGQKPITYFRQVSSLITFPWMLEQKEITRNMPADVIARAKHYIKNCPGGTGAYTHSQGLDVLRKDVAAFITARDGLDRCNPEHIFLTDGASPAVKLMIQIAIRGPKDGIMIPIPQYPLYSASITLAGGAQVGYYLDEDNNWSLSLSELERAYNQSVKEGITPRALTLINPGNPTGAVLTEAAIKDCIKFCHEHDLVLLADEVYQDNIYTAERPFVSCRKILLGMEEPYRTQVQLASFHSISKGFYGECGRRGGYMELVNVPDAVRAELYKLASVNLCSNIEGQIITGLMCAPPKKGEPSYKLYKQERDAILTSMKERAGIVADTLNSLAGVTCNKIEGAMYAFPRITLSKKALEAAHKAGKVGDTFYCLEMLRQTGLIVVPGSGFGQMPDTWHYRTTILPKKEVIKDVMDRVKVAHNEFMEKYA